VILAPLAWASGPDPQQLLYSTEGNRLRRVDVDSIDQPELLQDVLIERASAGGRDVNGMICPLPDGSGRFVLGEDSGQPRPKPGWGLFSADGRRQLGKLTPSTFVAQGETFGCVFDSEGILFGTEVGTGGFGADNGQLIRWFPPYDVFPGPEGAYPDTDAVSTNFCKIAVDIGTATGLAIDEQDRVYVAASLCGGRGVPLLTPLPHRTRRGRRLQPKR
jgi:hypothetical protein